MRKARVALRHRHAPHKEVVLPKVAAAAMLPLCQTLSPIGNAPQDSAGAVLVRQLSELRPGRFAISILAHALPPPAEYGPYDAYQGLVYLPDLITWVFTLYPSPEMPATWSGSFTEASLNPAPNGVAQVRPLNTETNATGSAVLQGRLR